MPPDDGEQTDSAEPPPMTREQLWFAMRRESEGMRDLQEYLRGIEHLDDAAFAEATGGADRAEVMDLLEKLDRLLAETDKIITQLHPDVN